MQRELLLIVRKKNKCLYSLLAIVFVSYFTLPLTLAMNADILLQPSIFGISFIWIYTFLQIPLTWLLGWIYFRLADYFDQKINRVLEQRDF